MKGRERALRALNHEEPDKVPIWETKVDPPHQKAMTGMSRKKEAIGIVEAGAGRIGWEKALLNSVDINVDCYRMLGFDLISAGISAPKGWKAQEFPGGIFSDEWGRIFKTDVHAETSISVDSTVRNMEDWESHPFPDPHAPGRLDTFKYLVKKVKAGEMLVVGETRTPFALAWEVFTPMNFCQLLFEKPQFIAQVIEQITDFNIEVIKLLIEAGAELIMSGGDIAEKNGPIIPPRYFENIIYPNMRKETALAHRMGVKFIKHTDGYVTPLIDGLVNKAAVDGLHSLDPSAGVNIGEIKEKYGDKLILMGNVSTDNLATKSKKEIIGETKECIRLSAPGGGFILSSSNSWYADCKLENCLTMLETGRRYGVYPLNLLSKPIRG